MITLKITLAASLYRIIFCSFPMQQDLYMFLPSVLVSGLQRSVLFGGKWGEGFGFELSNILIFSSYLTLK